VHTHTHTHTHAHTHTHTHTQTHKRTQTPPCVRACLAFSQTLPHALPVHTPNTFPSQSFLYTYCAVFLDGARPLACACTHLTLSHVFLRKSFVYTYCAVCLDGKGPARQYGPLALGLVYAAGLYCAGPYTGASMNPARSLAAALTFWDFTGAWVGMLAVMAGGACGAFAYKSLFRIERRGRDESAEYVAIGRVVSV